jgi:hypothetical protein
MTGPDWTDFNDSDPGMTLLQLLTFTLLALLFSAALLFLGRRWRRRRSMRVDGSAGG